MRLVLTAARHLEPALPLSIQVNKSVQSLGPTSSPKGS